MRAYNNVYIIANLMKPHDHSYLPTPINLTNFCGKSQISVEGAAVIGC